MLNADSLEPVGNSRVSDMVADMERLLCVWPEKQLFATLNVYKCSQEKYRELYKRQKQWLDDSECVSDCHFPSVHRQIPAEMY